MTENKDNMLAVGNNEESPSDLMSEIQKLRSEMLEDRQRMSAESEKNKMANDEKNLRILEKLQSIEDLVSKNQGGSMMDTEDAERTHSTTGLSLDNPKPVNTPEIVKSFVLKHVFKNAEEFEVGKDNLSEKEEHFGANWCINLIHENNFLQFFLRVDYPGEGWMIDTKCDHKIIESKENNFTKTSSGRFKERSGYGYHEFLEWEEIKKSYLTDGNLTAEIHVKIIETTGLRKEKFRSFDESVKEVSDIVLVVKERKFYVNRTFLAAQSSFFKALLLGNFSESKKSEVTLTGIDPEDFHFFLEVLYGELAIDESNVGGIALLADMYDAPTAIRRCEDFMIKNSKKSLKKKLQMSTSYNLVELKKQCLEEIKTAEDIRSVVPMDIQDLDHSVTTDLLKKALSLLA